MARNLETRLNQTIREQPNGFNQASIDRVRRLINHYAKRTNYATLKNIEDFRLYFNLFPEWNERRPARKFKSFRNTLYKFINNHTTNPKKREELRRRVLELQVNNNGRMNNSFRDWKRTYDKHLEWQGKSIYWMERDKQSGGSAFYQAFYKWTKRIAEDDEERSELIGRLFGRKELHDWTGLRTLRSWKRYYGSHPEFHKESTKERHQSILDGSSNFQSRFYDWVNTQTDNPKRRREMREYVLNHKTDDWTTFKRLEDWKKEFKKHRSWGRKTTSELHASPTNPETKFYQAFYKWTKRTAEDDEERRELTRSIYPERLESRYNSAKRLRESKYYIRELDDGRRRFYSDSQSEGAAALLLARYIVYGNDHPFIIREGKNFQVHNKGINNGGIDFLVDGEFLEWHPIVLARSSEQTYGHIPEKEYFPYTEALRRLPKKEGKAFKQKYARKLAKVYLKGRQAAVDNSGYAGANVALATNEKELYDFMSKHGAELPSYEDFRREFGGLCRYVKQFKVEKAQSEAA